MHHQHYHRQARRLLSHSHLLLTLLGAAALLAALAVAGAGSSASAAPQAGAPSLMLVNISDNALTLEFKGWALNEVITLGYSSNNTCTPVLPLPNDSFSAEANDFTAPYDWPANGIQPGTYYLCATGSVSSGPFPTQQTITVNPDGTLQATSTPGTQTPGATSSPGSPTSTSSPGTSSSPGASRTPSASSNGGGNPGNGGTQAGSNSGATLAAIILLCILVLALLVYLVRIWLQGRHASGGTQGP